MIDQDEITPESFVAGCLGLIIGVALGVLILSAADELSHSRDESMESRQASNESDSDWLFRPPPTKKK